MRNEALQKLHRVAATPDAFLVGGAIGTGIMAQAAERGGADFLLALNAGRLRVMGAPSLTSMLPLRPSNAFVAGFARTEILTQSSLPVLFGVNAMDPDLDVGRFVDDLARWRFAGATNFPTSIHYPVATQRALQAAGLGFEREMAVLSATRERGLLACAYVQTGDQADLAAEAGADLVCINVGWNAGGTKGAVARLSIDQVAVVARQIVAQIARQNPDAICLLEGGPIVDAEQLARVCQETRIAGYVGGSTLDRLPLEDSVSDRTQAFKLAALLGNKMRRGEEALQRFGREIGLVGGSKAMLAAVEKVRQLAQADSPVLITGAPGSGRSLAAEAVHGAGHPQRMAMLSAEDMNEVELAALLFGKEEASAGDGARRVNPGLISAQAGSSLLVEHVDLLSRRVQGRLARFLDRGTVTPVRGRRVIRSNARLICTSDTPLGALIDRGLILPELARHFAGGEIALPPLRERMEDFVDVLEHNLIAYAGPPAMRSFHLTPQALHRLMKHDWPGDLRECQSFVARLAGGAYEGPVGPDMAGQLLDGGAPAPRIEIESERDLVLHALRRHRFRRGETAAYLRISRKTLYNKIRKYGLSV